MNKIKIAQIITRLDWGGSPDIVRTLLSRLDTELFDLYLVSGDTEHPSSKTMDLLHDFTIKNRLLIIPEMQREINPLKNLQALFKLYTFMKKEKFQIVHTHTAKAGALGRLAAFVSGVPIIVHTMHGHNFYGYFHKFFSRVIVILERLLAGLSRKIIVLTELEKNDLVKFGVCRPDKITLIYQGLELDQELLASLDRNKAKLALGVTPGEKVVGMIARLEPIKGVEYFIDAAKLVSQDAGKIKFILVGEGTLRESLEKKIKDLNLGDQFIMTGWREDIPEIIVTMDLLVLSSLNEAVGIALIQAQSAGVPVVATNVGGIPEVVCNGKTGILVPASDAKALSQAIHDLLADPERRKQMSVAAKSWIGERFSIDKMIKETTNLYLELVQRNK